MEDSGVLNLHKSSPKVRKGALTGGAIGVLLTVGGYALNRWGAASFNPQGGDGGILIGLPSIVPLLPLAYLIDIFGGHFPRKWDQGDLIWQAYCTAMLLNTILLAALGAIIGYIVTRVFGNR